MSKKNKFIVFFDFTTVHAKSRFAGRAGEMEIETAAPLEQVRKDTDELKGLALQVIHSKKPSYKVLMINIKDIKPA